MVARMPVKGLLFAAALFLTLFAVTATASAAPGIWSDVNDTILAPYGITEGDLAGISEGAPDGTWGPHAPLRRAQLAKIALAAFELPVAHPAVPSYTDVAPDSSAYVHVEGAAAADLMRGFENGSFGPEDVASRQQTVAVIARYVAKSKGIVLEDALSPSRIDALLAPFADAAEVSTRLRPEMAYAVAQGIIRGDSATRLRPEAPTTRLQGAALVLRAEGSQSLGASVFETVAGQLKDRAVGEILGYLGLAEPDQTQEVLDKLKAMDEEIDTIKSDLETVITDLGLLADQLALDTNEVESAIAGLGAQEAVSRIKTHFDEDGYNSLHGFAGATPGEVSAADIAQFRNNIQGAWDIQFQVTSIHDAILPEVGPQNGLLDHWTQEFLLTGMTADNLFDRYRTLEGYFSTLLLYQAKGATLVVEAENAEADVLGPDQPPLVTSYLATFREYINEEADRFEDCVLRLVFATTDFAGDLSGGFDFLPASASDVLARAQYVLAKIRGDGHYGFRGYLISTEDAPSLKLMAPSSAAPDGKAFTPGLDASTHSGPNYDSWSVEGTEMKVASSYTVTRVDFGDVPPGTYTVWGQAPGYLVALGDVTVTTYDDNFDPDPDGAITYGGFLVQTRGGGPTQFLPGTWADDALDKHVSKGDGKASATVVQDPQNLEVTTSGSVAPHGSFDYQTDPDISVEVEVSRSFKYTGAAKINGILHYNILPTGTLHASPEKNNVSTVYHYGLWNITDGRQVALATGGGDLFNNKFKSFDGKNVVDILAVTLEPNKQYKIYAKWIVKVPGGQTEDTSGYSFSTASTLDCIGAAITFPSP